MITCLFSSNVSLSCGDAQSILKATMHNITYSAFFKDRSRSPDCCYKGRCCCSSMGVNCFWHGVVGWAVQIPGRIVFLSQPFNINTTFRRHQSIATCKHRRKKSHQDDELLVLLRFIWLLWYFSAIFLSCPAGQWRFVFSSISLLDLPLPPAWPEYSSRL